MRLSEGRSQTGDGRKDLSGYGRPGMRPSDRHSLPGDGRETCRDTESNRRPSEGHSQTGDGGRNLSEHRKKPTKRGVLTD